MHSLRFAVAMFMHQMFNRRRDVVQLRYESIQRGRAGVLRLGYAGLRRGYGVEASGDIGLRGD